MSPNYSHLVCRKAANDSCQRPLAKWRGQGLGILLPGGKGSSPKYWRGKPEQIAKCVTADRTVPLDRRFVHLPFQSVD